MAESLTSRETIIQSGRAEGLTDVPAEHTPVGVDHVSIAQLEAIRAAQEQVRAAQAELAPESSEKSGADSPTGKPQQGAFRSEVDVDTAIY